MYRGWAYGWAERRRRLVEIKNSAVNQARGTSGCAAVHVFDAVGAVLCVSALLVRLQRIVNVIWRRRGDSVHTRRTRNSDWRNLGG